MTERAAQLVDRVFPRVPVRQWVLTLPPRLRYLLAFDHALCRAVTAAFLGAVFAWLGRRARRHAVERGRAGAVVILQRFGAALNLNVHVHALVLDGVFVSDGAGGVRFEPLDRAGAGDEAEMADLLAAIERRIARRLVRAGREHASGAGGPDPWVEAEPALAGLAAASVLGVAATGARRGVSVRRWGEAVDRPEPRPAGARDRLERLCRYALRPPVGQDRLQAMSDGTVALELRRRWTDGTTHVIFEPVELLERLAALVPRPRINLVLYYGVLAARAAWRRAVVPGRSGAASEAPDAQTDRERRRPNPRWAELMQRSFGFDVLACPRCAGRLTLVALIRAPAVVERILRHLGLPTEVPRPRRSRDPPIWSHHAHDGNGT